MGLANFFKSVPEYSQAELFIAAAAISDPVQQAAIRTLVVNLTPIWKKLLAVYPMVGGTAAAHQFNLKVARDSNAAYRLIYTGSPVHSAAGIAWNNNSYANTNLHFTTSNIPFNSLHISYYSTVAMTAFHGEMGNETLTSGAFTGLFLRGATDPSFYYVNDNADSRTRTAGTTGLYVLNRFGGTSSLVENNVLKGSNTGADAGNHNPSPLMIGMVNGAISMGGAAFATIGEGLTTAEGTVLYNAIQTFQTSLGRQV